MRFSIIIPFLLGVTFSLQAEKVYIVPPANQEQMELVFSRLDNSNAALKPSLVAWQKNESEKAKKLLLNYFRQRRNVNWFFSRHDRERLINSYQELFPGAKRGNVSQADSILFGKWFWYGRYLDCGFPPRWEESQQDAEYTWQLNRHGQFNTLGRAYWLTGDRKYSAAFARMATDWVDSVRPPREGEIYPPWRVLEAGIRAKTWLAAWQFFIDSPEFSSDLLIRFLFTIIEHKEYLKSHSPIFVSGRANGNHFIMESEGLFYFALMFPELAGSSDDLKMGRQGLEKCSRHQVLDDGVQVEQTPAYHRGCISWFGAPLLLAKRNNIEFSSDYLERTRRMFDFMAHITRPNGEIAPYGDSDPDRSESVFAFGRILFDEPVTPQGSRMTSEQVLRRTFWQNNGLAPEKTVSGNMKFKLFEEFPDGGFYCNRTSWEKDALYMVLRNGADTLSSWHKQADHLSIDVSAYGTPLVIDPGRYTYTANEWRRYFKETINHNTISVDGKNSVVFSKHLEWEDLGKTGYSGFNRNANGLSVSAWHESFDPARTERKVTLVEDRFWIIEDRVTGLTENEVVISYFFPTTEVSLLDGGYLGAVTNVSEDRASLVVLQLMGESQAGLDEGWFSIEYTHKQPNRILRFRENGVKEKYRSVHLLIPFPAGEDQQWQVEKADDDYRVSVFGSKPCSKLIKLEP